MQLHKLKRRDVIILPGLNSVIVQTTNEIMVRVLSYILHKSMDVVANAWRGQVRDKRIYT